MKATAEATKVTERGKDMERINAMRKISIAIAALTLILAIGCKNQNQPASTNADNNSSNNSIASQQTTNMSPEDLGKLGAEIKKHPGDAQKLLSDKGLTEQPVRAGRAKSRRKPGAVEALRGRVQESVVTTASGEAFPSSSALRVTDAPPRHRGAGSRDRF